MSDGYDGRLPPQDPEAERAVLGSMLLSKDAIADVVESPLRGVDFYRPAHEQIFDTVVDMFGRGEPVDTITVVAELTRRGIVDKVGGAVYLHDLSASVPITANADYYAGIVAEKAVLRRLIDASTRSIQMAYGQEGDVTAIVDRAQAEILNVTGNRDTTDYQVVGEVFEETIDEIEAISGRGEGTLPGLSTGFVDLDEITGGLHPGQMVVVAARPAVGKSTLALDFCRAASVRHGATSVIFSLEMTRHEITTRLISAEAKVSLAKLRGGHLADHDWGRVSAAMPRIVGAPFYIDDSPNMTMTEIRAKARRLRQNQDLRLVVIDYIQLMSSGRRVENRQVEVSEFSRQMKLLAKELEVPVVALSQLNRGPEQRTNKRPMLSDLRESGAIEQDADIVILLHREDMYERESVRLGEADMIVAKHRNGVTRDVVVAFQGHYSRFVDMAEPT